MLERFIKIIENDNDIIVNFLFMKIKFNKNRFYSKYVKDAQVNVSEWVKKYKYVLETNIKPKVIKGFEKTIWTCWFQGIDQAPPIVKTAMSTHSLMNPNHPIIVITEKNLSQYVTPPLIYEKNIKMVSFQRHIFLII